jgi:iron complex outermembrane receptor protein
MVKRIHALLAGASVLCLASVGPALAQSDDSNVLTEIVVTAQKRTQNLQDVPVAVTALTAEALESNRIRNVLDLNALVPNMRAAPSAGGSNLPSFTLRGVQSTGAIPGAEKQVGLYIDGVYVGVAAGSIFDLAHIEQVEVMRGPQGTLFGQNATAGAVSIRTPTPTGEFGGRVDLGYGNYDQIRAGVLLNLPTMGPFSASVGYMHSERRGDIRNLGAGTTWDFRGSPQSGFDRQTSPKWLGNDNVEAVSAALKFDPTDNFTATYKFYWVDKETSPEGVGLLGVDTTFLGGLLAGLIANPATNRALLTPIGDRRPDAANNWWNLPTNTRNQGHMLTAQWSVTDSLTIKNTFGYLKSRLSNRGNQLDGFGGVFVAPGVPFVVVNNLTHGRNKQWSNELQVNYDSDLVTVTAGYLHYDFKSEQGNPPQLSNSYVFTAMPGFVAPLRTTITPTNHTKADAVYAQAEVHVTSQLDAVLGYRHTWDKKSGTADFPLLPRTFTFEDKRPSYSVGLNFKPVDDTLLYGKYSTAYVAGGSFSGFQWDPETAKSWEAGIKSDLLGRRLRLNLALFTVKYTNMQFTTGGTTLVAVTGRTELGVLPAVNANAGDARAKGFEFEATAVPVDRLTLGAGVGYTHFKYTRTTGFLGPITVVVPHHRPKWTVNVYAQYETEPVYGDAYVSFRVDAAYRAKFHGTSNDLSAQLAGRAEVDSTTLVNGRVALTELAVAGRKVEIALWGRNLFNNKNVTFPVATPMLYSATWERARTYGVDLNFEF